jgi:hypothetical protein
MESRTNPTAIDSTPMITRPAASTAVGSRGTRPVWAKERPVEAVEEAIPRRMHSTMTRPTGYSLRALQQVARHRPTVQKGTVTRADIFTFLHSLEGLD